jgi:hypothetical protein
VLSVIRQAGDRVNVVVSDNSDTEQDRQVLQSFCAGQDPRLLTYVRPPQPLPMSAHWEWAMRQATQISRLSHFAVLTDRMIFRPGFLPELLEIADRYPDDVVSFNYDMVEDSTTPVHLELEPWSGQLLSIAAGRFLELSSRGVLSNALPRMLNSVAPRKILTLIRERFGSVFASVSPDVCFAYRCLALVDRILYYDKAGLIQYAIGKSQGINYERGIPAPEVADFAALQGGTTLNLAAAPVPEIQTMINSVFHEYGSVKAESQSRKFPEVDHRAYLGTMAWSAIVQRDSARKRDVWRLLSGQGWTPIDTLLWFSTRIGQMALHNPGRLLDAMVAPLRRRRRFLSTDEAIAWAIRHPRRRSRSLAHQWQLRPRPVAEAPGNDRNADEEALISA